MIPAGLATAFAAQKAALAVVAVVVAAVLAIPLVAPPTTSVAPGPDPGAPPAAAASTTPVVDASDTRRPAPGGSLSGSRSPAPAATKAIPAADVAAAAPVRRSLVDRDGKALEGVRMRAAATTTVRWQGGDRGWISGAGRTLRILAEQEERLRTDPRYADEFFAKLPLPEEWRATVLDEALPQRDVRTDREGTFVFPPPLPVDDRTIDVADPSFVLVTAGSAGATPWVAGPAVRVEGSVHDADGAPIADATAIAMCPTAQEPIELHAQSATRTDEQGAFLVRRALANGLLRVSCDGYETVMVRLSRNPVQRPYVVLNRPGFATRRTITGIVTTSGGAPIGKAAVWFGRQHTTTADDGRFTLAADAAKPQYALTIVAKGWAALQLPDFGKQVLSNAPLQNLTFVLEEKPRSMRGFVVGPDGTAVEGALVFLVDPTLLDITFDTVESRVAEAPAVVRTDANGSFVLDGLDDRPYRVRAVDPRTGASETSRASKPGSRVLKLQLPKAGLRLQGHLVDADGLPLRDATVEIAFFTHVTKGGGTQMESTPAVACSDAGGFEMSVGPDTNAWLCVRVHGQIRQMTPAVELLARRPIRCDGSRWLTLLFAADRDGRPAHFLMADGTLDANRLDTWSGRPIAIPKGAVAVVLDKETPEMVRLELTDDLAVHLRVP
ncbi:MAG: carboxypeptidase regulatory-like domain-containing protein [Planctomycetes bacterium]|nr:carboxypeptidase regulatory-like domain-containing protein [Planctomycetota bacterium]